MATVGERIRAAREAKRPHMTQGELGRRVGLSADRVNKIEQNARGIGAVELNLIAQALDVRVEALLRDNTIHYRGDPTKPGVDLAQGRLEKFLENWLTAQALLWVHEHSA